MLFYDFEVFKYNWLVVVMDMAARKKHVIIDDPDALEKLYKEKINDIWVGYNSRSYDQWILKAILAGFNPKKMNDHIILKGRSGYSFSSLLRSFPLNNFDVIMIFNLSFPYYNIPTTHANL